MSAFTYGEAARMAFSGFGLVRRQPLTILAWGVFSALAMAAVVGLAGLMMAPALISIGEVARDSAAAPPNPAQIMGSILGLVGGYLVLLGGILVVNTVQGSAVFRTVLEPGRGGLAHLQIGSQELWLLIVAVSAFILLSMAMMPFSMAMSIVMVMTGGARPAAAPDPNAPPSVILSTMFPASPVFWGMELVLMVFSLFLMSRFIMAFPMTFADRRFRLFESWGLTRGHTLKMALMIFLQGISQYLAMFAFVAVLALVAAATVMTRLPDGGMAAMAGKPLTDWIALIWPVLAVAAVVAVPFFGVFAALYYVPLAETYLKFKPPAADAFT